MTSTTTEAFAGCLLGTAAGDAVGLPFEGLSRRRVRRWLGAAPIEHRLLFGRGLVSDDTEHACLVAQALLVHGDDPERFARALGWRLKFWLAALPAAVGFATLRGIARLWLGFSPETSGVVSAGNGAAMRAPVIGVWAADDVALRRALVRASTRLTHRDQRAEDGARVVAAAAAIAKRSAGHTLNASQIIPQLLCELEDDELGRALEAVPGAESVERLAEQMGLARGITGYVNHTVPIAIAAWLKHAGCFRTAVEHTVRLGGDTDTTAAIVGALVGTGLGPQAIPAAWLDGIIEYPRSIAWMQRLAERLATRGAPLSSLWPLIPMRNAAFTLIVLALAGRRMLPPY
ncbi:MAG: ADP-ribosylglycohydrolase family protein [Myxococcales bacterium]|nr:ADP-ribosylglycohydrolase family protein [Myxococcales bacterium]